VYRSTTNPTFERTTNGDAPLSPFVVRSTFTSGRLPMLNGSYFSAVLLGGAIGGALDILFAISFAAYNGFARVRLLQTVASGLLGVSAFAGGVPVAVLGLVLHFGLSFLWATVFSGLALLAPFLIRYPFVAGVGFGVAVFLVMRLVVLPLSAFPYPVTFEPLATTLDLLSHALLFGFPIALALRKGLIGVSSAA